MTSTQRLGPPSASGGSAGRLGAGDLEGSHPGHPVAARDRDTVHRDAVERRLVAVRGDVLGQDPVDAVRKPLAARSKPCAMLENQAFGFGDFCHHLVPLAAPVTILSWEEASMARAKLIGLIGLIAGLAAGAVGVQAGDRAESRTVLGSNDLLAQGAEEIRTGQYDEGIRHTSQGLVLATSVNERAAALSNLCAAYAAKGKADQAIEYCTQSLALRDNNWRAYSNRSYAYYLKGQYGRAHEDLEIAASINPDGRPIETIRGMINEKSLRPTVTMEDHR